jgi:hypothetical protein
MSKTVGTILYKSKSKLASRFSGDANLLKAISILLIAGGLIFEGLRKILLQ